MKKRFLLTLVPVVACASLIASGYAVWYFGLTGNSTETNVTVTTTDKTNAGSFAVSGSISLELDQPSDSSTNPNGKGANFTDSLSIEFNFPASHTSLDGYVYTYTLTFTATNEKLLDYVSFSFGSTSLNFDTTSHVATATLEHTLQSSDSVFTVYGDSNKLSASYVDGKVPTTEEAYDTMLTDLYGSNTDENTTQSSELLKIQASFSAVAPTSSN